MVWVRFTAAMDWKPRPSVTIGYLAGMDVNVTRACADRALAGGKAVKLEKRIRHAAPVEVSHDD